VDGLRVHVLGPLEVEGVEPADLGSRKARSLLKLLALARGRPVPVDRITDVLWGDEPPAHPPDQVSVLVSRLRRVVGAERLPRSDAGYAVVADWFDVDELEARVDEAAAHLESGRLAAAGAVSRSALALLRGDLLADEPDPWWAEAERASVARLAARARLVAADTALRRGDPLGAAELAAAALDHDPYDEVALRLLMRAHAAAGRPGSALAAYATARARLAEELGVSPGAETEALHTALLLDDDHGRPPDGGSLPSATSPLAGRGPELDRLDAALARAGSTGVQLVVIEGEAGIGKTALVDAWTARVRARGTVVLAGGADALGRSLPFQPIADAIDTHLRGLEPDDAAAVLGEDVSVLGAVLGRLPREGWEATAVLDRDPGQAIVFEALLDVVVRSGGGRPMALVLDDVHLAGSSTIEWLHFAVRRGSGRPAVIVVTRRGGEEGGDLPGVRIALGPVDLEAAAAIVGPDRARDMYERSGGHPLFLVELAAAPAEQLPTSIRDIVARQCDAAGPEVATTLRTAALLGPVVDLDLLRATRPIAAPELVEHLEAGLARRLLEERADGFGFRHELVREAMIADVSSPRRTLVHRLAAAALARRPDADPLAVAHHARLGGDTELEAEANERAATIAIERFDYDTADELLGRTIARRDTAAARLQRARVRLMMRRFDEALDDVDHAQVAGAGAEALEVAAWIAYYRRDLAAAIRLAEEGVRRAGDDDVRARCLAVLGRSRHNVGQIDEAERNLRLAVDLARGQDAAIVRVWLGILEVHRHRIDTAIDLLRSAHRASGNAGLSFAPPYAAIFTAHALALAGRPAEALRVLEPVVGEVRRRGTSRLLGVPENFRAWILRNLGAPAEADETNEAALAAVPTEGAEPNVHAELDLLAGRLMAGDEAGARARLARVDRSLAAWKTFVWRSELRRLFLGGRLALLAEDWDTARQRAAELRSAATEVRSPRYQALGALLDAEAGFRSGDGADREAADAVVARLAAVAPLESWWLTAALADAAGEPRWRAQAEERVAALAGAAGPYRDTLIRAASARLASPR
jgi:DNA-binding SARP family transcriptional activator